MAEIEGLPELVTEVEKAMVRAQMYDQGFDGDCDKGFVGWRTAYNDSGTADTNGAFTASRVSWPDGRWTYEDGTSLPDGFNVTWDATWLFKDCKTAVEQVFTAWIDGPVPEPSDFDSALEACQAAVERINVSGTTLDGKGVETDIKGGNTTTVKYANYIHDELIPYQGDMIDAFDTNYASRVDEILAGQFALAAILCAVIAGEQESWRMSREEVVEFAEGSAKAFNDYADGGGGSWKSVLDGAGFIATALGLAFPAAGAAGTVIGLVSSFVPEEPEQPVPFLEGDDADGLYESFLLARSDVIDRGGERERALWDLAQRGTTSRDDHPEYYDLSRPKNLLTNDDGEYFKPGENIQVLMPHLREIAARFKLIGNIQDAAAADLVTTRPETPWKRHTYLPQSPWWTFQELESVAASSLKNSRNEMYSVAERLVEVSYDFEATDATIQAELERQVHQVKKAGDSS